MAPGGGHRSLWIMHEGVNPALALNEKGIAVFILKNRLQSSGYTFDVEGLADMQRAIRTVRSRAAEWGVDPAKIGAAGFSAGGELAALAALRNDAGRPDAADPVERVSSRPDFQVLVYPGKSHLIQPVAGSPPAFLAAGFDDRPDISTGLAEAYLRFKKAGVQAELHMYANVGHGFGVRPERAGQSQQEWTTQLVAFLRQAKLIGDPRAAELRAAGPVVDHAASHRVHNLSRADQSALQCPFHSSLSREDPCYSPTPAAAVLVPCRRPAGRRLPRTPSSTPPPSSATSPTNRAPPCPAPP